MSAERISAKTDPRATCLMMTEDDIYLLSNGTWQRSWEKMGAHPDTQDGARGWRFRVWAPLARSVRIVGDFNRWDVDANHLKRILDSDIWEGFIADLKRGELYKFVIETEEGNLIYKADPYAFFAERAPGTASRLMDLADYAWSDDAWMAARRSADHMKRPLNIYEVHLGSWRRHGDAPQGEPDENGGYPGPGDSFPAQRGVGYTYDELAEELVAYIVEMGYTHVEIMPIMEHPFDGSWGYQPTGYFAATSRYGEPRQLMHLIDSFHAAGIGVILDWVPGGFCADEHGLSLFNGHMLYEREIHPNWGTHKFDYSRGEVRSFLVSNALFWIEVFHADGIRMDGVSSMLYLNFGIDDPALKRTNRFGTEEDLDASAFIRQVNGVVGRAHPDCMMIAEESTAWPLVTYPPEEGGLGFHYKWDMGWMNDTLHYMQTDFPWRAGNHRLLTFSIMYAFNENFVMPLSHDEVVHGKCSLIGRMPGDSWRRYAGLRTLLLYQMAHPGAQLNFMGAEIAQTIEWRYYESLQWFLIDESSDHARHQVFTRAMNHLFRDEPAFWQRAYAQTGFTWIDADDAAQSIVSFVRHADHIDNDLLFIINFDPASYESFHLGVPREGVWQVVMDSDDPSFGGSGYPVASSYASLPYPWNGCDDSIDVALPGLAGLVFKRIGPSPCAAPHAGSARVEADEPHDKGSARRARSSKKRRGSVREAPEGRRTTGATR
ncbi:1,4-alpha-glucan branching protein GlgB [Coriobacterium glomerans]